jgi:hypothetical protein
MLPDGREPVSGRARHLLTAQEFTTIESGRFCERTGAAGLQTRFESPDIYVTPAASQHHLT